MVQYSSLPGATVTAIRKKRLSDVEDFEPDMVILQIGTNDLADDQCTHETLILVGAFYLPTFAEIHFLSSVHCKIVHTVYFQLSLAFLQ